MFTVDLPPAPKRPQLSISKAHLARRRAYSHEYYLVMRMPGATEGGRRSVLFFNGTSFSYGTDKYYHDDFEYLGIKELSDVKVAY